MEKKIEGICDVRDESDRDGMRLVIELKRDAIPNVVLNQLYKHTAMQSTFGVIMLALVNGAPKVMNLKELLEHFIEHRHEIIVRRTQFDLDAAAGPGAHPRGPQDRRRQHRRGDQDHPRLEGHARRPTRGSASGSGCREKQSEAILNMRLARLTGLEIDKLEAELKEVRATIKELQGDPGLASRSGWRILKDEMAEVAKRLRRRAAHRDRGRPGRVLGRGPDRRRGHGDHHLPLRLHQADPGHHLPAAAARRPGPHRRRPRKTTGSSTSSSPAPTTT